MDCQPGASAGVKFPLHCIASFIAQLGNCIAGIAQLTLHARSHHLGQHTRDGLLDLQTTLLMQFNASICVCWGLVRRMAVVLRILRRLSAWSPDG